MNDCSSSSCSACGPWWRLPLMLALVLAAVYLVRHLGPRETASPPAAEPIVQSGEDFRGEHVSLVIDFGAGRRKEYDAIAWRDGMTVRDALIAAGDASANLEFSQRGSGEAALLTGIEDARNEGAGGRNWTYSVNGSLADRSFAIYRLQPGDEVLWSFATEQ